MCEMSVVFIILHYLTLSETCACVESILSRSRGSTWHIVIVDNGSPNGSGEDLYRRYAEDSRITVILNVENLGFARGCNVGITYARSHFDPDFIAVCNNDTLLLSDGFASILRQTWEETGFAVLGPRIETPDGRCDTNPYGGAEPASLARIEDRIRRETRSLRIAQSPLLYAASRIRRCLKKAFSAAGRLPVWEKDTRSVQENMVLHGSFLVFSRTYFDHFDGFYDRTFLYNEEYILHYRVRRAGLRTIFQPAIRVFHKEDAATDDLRLSPRKKQVFLKKHSLDSLRVFADLLREDVSGGRFF